ncbi:MAG: hypothetical protein CFE21_16205 [Bacteroidetes bacterium B1(2017)]|nr:MAG: hypothetical protein CFE21_16205 [Bacteroidetes bacterium B1(2017)]
MKKIFTLLLLCISAFGSFAQKEAKNWHFGNNAAIVFPYNSLLPSAITTSQMNANEGVASISDGAGNLLFYTDGVSVWDRTNAVMPNGTGLLGNSSSTQSSIIVPWPGSTTKYYIFTTPAVAAGFLMYSVVDMTVVGNGSSGSPAGGVVLASKNTQAPSQGTNTAEKVTAVKKADGSGYYVVSLQQPDVAGNGKLLVYDVTASGVAYLNFLLVPGMKVFDYYGYLKFSPDGSKLAMACYFNDRVNIFGFNTNTGIASPLNLITDSVYLDNVYGVEFSPNGKYLYTTCSGNAVLRYLNQYDISLGTDALIKASRTLIYSYTPVGTPYYGFGAVQLGPDNRIYVARGGETALSYINTPNANGVGCTYMNNGIPLSGKMSFQGLPNYLPNFATPVNNCSYFLPDKVDTNCCTSGISRNLAGGPAVTSIRYTVSGGVIQGYSASCNAAPSSVSLSGTATGLVTFTPACANLSFFNTSLQSTTSSGSMVVSYWVKFVGGDSCKYTIDVKGCPRAPQIKCDSIKTNVCVCAPGSAGMNYLNFYITNQSIPTSPICGVIINKYTSGGVLVPNFWQSGIVVGTPNVNLSSAQVNTTISVSGTNTLPGQMLNIQAYYFSSPPFSGYVTVSVIHCNGDTCKVKWTPSAVPLTDVNFVNYGLKAVKSPFQKISAYSFRIAGPSETKLDPNPYKVRYVTFGIMDSVNGPEIVGSTGAEQYYTKERAAFLRMKYTSHARYNALLELSDPLMLAANDSSGIFQLFFANGNPRNITFNCYDDNGSILSGGTIQLDSSGSVGVIQLGKTNTQGAGILLFNGYPNPTQDRYTMMLSLPYATDVNLVVMDLQGKEVLKKSYGKLRSGLSEISLEMGQLSTGTYLVQLIPTDANAPSNALRVVLVK